MHPFLLFLDSADHSLTALLNFDGGAWMDTLWWTFSSRTLWIVPAAIFIYAMLHGRRSPMFILSQLLCIALVVYLCDHTTSAVFKPWFMRLRPSHDPTINTLLHYVGNYRGGLYGFMSSHAANAFGVWGYVALMFRRRAVSLSLLLLASLVAYSRVYLGVHFVGDIVCGAIFGASVGAAVAIVAKSLCHFVAKQKESFRFSKGILSTRQRNPFARQEESFWNLKGTLLR